MYDLNVFAVLTAWDQKNKASSAFQLPENSIWFRPAVGGVAARPTIDSREATPAEDSQSDDDEAGAVDRLVVTFSELMKNPRHAIQAGTNSTSSHVLLGHRGTKGISARQYNIAVDDDLWIWLHDYHSTHGTAVSYDGQNRKEVRRKETWVLAYAPGTRNRFGETTIHSGSLAVKIEFPNHEAADPQYVNKLRAFKDAVEKSKPGILGVVGLGLDSGPATQPSSDAPTPSERLIYYRDRRIGKGAYGEVYRVIKVRDGKDFAAKLFSPPADRNKRRLDEVDPVWLRQIRREYTVMRDNPHPNVIQVFEFRETPEPMIIMAYHRHGDIRNAGIIDEDKYITAFGQILDGLCHLHSKGVVHRDLKPENLLVEMCPFFKVVITDFGLAKVTTETTLLKTFCGTAKYAAPEVFPGNSRSYGSPADVWSLGVIVLGWIYGIPAMPSVPKVEVNDRSVLPRRWNVWIDTWCVRILDKLKGQDDDEVIDILVHMLELVVGKRWSAHTCLARGMNRGLFQRRVTDGLVVCKEDAEDLYIPIREGEDELKAAAATMPQQAQASIDPDASIMRNSLFTSKPLPKSR